MEIGNLIKYYRQKENWTQKELASGICSVSYLSKIENGTVEPSEEILGLICERLDINMTGINLEDDEELMEMLHRWHNYIQHNDRKGAEELFKKIQLTASLSSSHPSQILFRLFLFRYRLFTNEMEQAQELFQGLQKMEGLLEREYCYYYFKFSGMFYLKLGQLEHAISSIKKAEEKYKRLHFKDPELFFYLSMIYSKKQELNRGIIYAQKALEMYQEILFYERITDCNLLLGIQYNNLGEFDIAEDYFKKLLPKNSNHIQARVLPKVYHNLGYIYYNRKNYEKALSYLQNSYHLKKIDSEKINTLYLIASCYFELDDRNKAKVNLKEGKRLATLCRNQKYTYKFYILEHQIHDALNDHDFITCLRDEILPYFEQSGEKAEYKDVVKLLGDIYFQNRQYKNAATIYQKLYM